MTFQSTALRILLSAHFAFKRLNSIDKIKMKLNKVKLNAQFQFIKSVYFSPFRPYELECV